MIETLPLDNHHPPWLDRRHFPFTSRFMEIEGHRVHYVDEGNGATLLFLHGNPTWSFLYRHIIAREILKSCSFLQQVSQSLCHLADKPALILWGDRDPAFRANQRLRFQQVFPNSKTVILSGAGHFVQEDSANQIVEVLRLFFRSDPI